MCRQALIAAVENSTERSAAAPPAQPTLPVSRPGALRLDRAARLGAQAWTSSDRSLRESLRLAIECCCKRRNCGASDVAVPADEFEHLVFADDVVELLSTSDGRDFR